MEPEAASVDSSGSRPVLGRRNLPRASQACQMCRTKKARCDQQDPCSNCVRHLFDCIYAPKPTVKAIRRKSTDPARDQITQNHGPIDASQGEENDICEEQEEQVNGEDDDITPHQVSDTVGDVNKHTSGTEYYGSSSNFSLLNQLFSHARAHASARLGGESSSGDSPATFSSFNANAITGDSDRDLSFSDTFSGKSEIPLLKHLNTNPLSIVNLLYNEESILPPSRPKTPIAEKRQLASPASTSSRPVDHAQTSGIPASSDPRHSVVDSNFSNRKRTLAAIDDDDSNAIRIAETLLEKEYVRLFFHNLHHLHPMLLLGQFTARCEKEIWNKGPLNKPRKNLMQFLALYNIVVAVGALVAGTDTLKSFEGELGLASKRRRYRGSEEVYSSMTLSKAYFRKSRNLLGDVFEVCSLESAQSLFLMSLYCQNSLKPHSCYMYSGMAVRTALAIGLPSESMSRSASARKAARRTWWVIYSHEIDMCCSSGRRDSLGKPLNYQIQYPQIKSVSRAPESELEDESLSMINVMVDFAVILRRASKQIYHDSKGLSLSEKSKIALELDQTLDAWRTSLPPWLNLDAVSFRESEWASKQKLVLQLRYLNARILFHRPFLASYASQNAASFEINVDLCLDAARKTIELFFQSYAHRHYFRTWWYNSTYILYAGMIILYLILLNYTKIPGEILIQDVEKSLEILRSMEESPVARRSADLIQELLECARTYLNDRQHLTDTSIFASRLADADSSTTNTNNNPTDSFWDSEWDKDISRTLFSTNMPNQSRGDILATLIDPSILEDFAGGNDMFGYLTDPMDSFMNPAFDGSGGDNGVTNGGESTARWQSISYAPQEAAPPPQSTAVPESTNMYKYA